MRKAKQTRNGFFTHVFAERGLSPVRLHPDTHVVSENKTQDQKRTLTRQPFLTTYSGQERSLCFSLCQFLVKKKFRKRTKHTASTSNRSSDAVQQHPQFCVSPKYGKLLSPCVQKLEEPEFRSASRPHQPAKGFTGGCTVATRFLQQNYGVHTHLCKEKNVCSSFPSQSHS